MLFESGESTVKFFGGFAVSGISFLGCFITTEVNALVLAVNYSPKRAWSVSPNGHPFESRCIGFVLFLITLVFGAGASAEIFPTVVVWLSIFVIYGMCRPLTCHDGPYDVVGHVGHAVYFYLPVSIAGYGSCDSDYKFFVESSVRSRVPDKLPGSGDVGEKFFAKSRIEVVARIVSACFAGFSHCLTLRRSLWLEAGKRWNASCLDPYSMELAPCQ